MTDIRDHLLIARGAIDGALTQLREPLPVKRILPVPYLPQWGVGADARRGDCGPANVAMLAHYLTDKRPTVDQAAAACGQPIPSSSTSFGDLQRGVAFYGVKLSACGPWNKTPLTLDIFKRAIDLGKPSIALINYGVLRHMTDADERAVKNWDRNYNKGHWVVFVGYDADGVYVHDPNYPPPMNDGNARWLPVCAFVAALTVPAEGNRYGSGGLLLA